MIELCTHHGRKAKRGNQGLLIEGNGAWKEFRRMSYLEDGARSPECISYSYWLFRLLRNVSSMRGWTIPLPAFFSTCLPASSPMPGSEESLNKYLQNAKEECLPLPKTLNTVPQLILWDPFCYHQDRWPWETVCELQVSATMKETLIKLLWSL